jgi:hypothetical protein
MTMNTERRKFIARWRGRSIHGRICRRPSTCPRQSTDRSQGDALPSQTDAI